MTKASIDSSDTTKKTKKESPHTQQQICLFSFGFSQMPNNADCDIEPDIDATRKELCVAHDAAFSRLRPIQDAIDFWALSEGGRSIPGTDSGDSAPV
jgi:hypothetical protein